VEDEFGVGKAVVRNVGVIIVLRLAVNVGLAAAYNGKADVGTCQARLDLAQGVQAKLVEGMWLHKLVRDGQLYFSEGRAGRQEHERPRYQG